MARRARAPKQVVSEAAKFGAACRARMRRRKQSVLEMRLRERSRMLAESRRRLSQIVQGSPIPTFVIDAGHRVTHWNKACENLTGVTAREAIGSRQQWRAFYAAPQPVLADLIVDSAPAEEIIRRYGATCRPSSLIEGAYEVESFFPDLGDGGKWLFFNASPLRDARGMVTGAVETLQDITARKTFEAEAMRAAHLATIGELAAGVAHEINNPVTGIINCAQILLDRAASSGAADSDIPAMMLQEGERIAAIVNNLLSFARPQQESFTPVPPAAIISDTLQLLARQLEKEGIRLVVDVPAGLPPVRARRRQIQQVLLNIISNARYALHEKKPAEPLLEICGSMVREGGAVFVRMTVCDNGTGIPAEHLDKLCNPFFSTKPSGKGTGLGLSISYTIVKEHGGRLTFDSRPGEYTRVIVDLPAVTDAR